MTVLGESLGIIFICMALYLLTYITNFDIKLGIIQYSPEYGKTSFIIFERDKKEKNKKICYVCLKLILFFQWKLSHPHATSRVSLDTVINDSWKQIPIFVFMHIIWV